VQRVKKCRNINVTDEPFAFYCHPNAFKAAFSFKGDLNKSKFFIKKKGL